VGAFVSRALVFAAVALLQACASPPPQQSAPAVVQPQGAIFESAPQAPVHVLPQPADATRLPPFDGEKETVEAPLRGLAKIDRTRPADDVWQRLRNGFAMPDLNGPLVQEKMAWYAARPDYLQRVFERSRRYLHYIVQEIEKRGLPTELALLPMVESAFNPMAYSRAHASGLWQFIPGTGKRYELKQNWWYDGRRDIVESTAAALDYLADLFDMHGDWHLALASYNWGENAVARAIEKNRAAGLPTDYSSLAMPAETRNYVPKLQALKNLIRDPQLFGITLDPIPNEPYFATVTKTRDIDVQLAAKLAEMSVEEFIALNPGFSRPLIRADLTPRIVLPADKVEVFRENLTRYDQKSLVSWKAYHPRPGEKIEAIAKKFGVTVARLKEVNGIAPRARALPSTLVVPANGAADGYRRLPIMYAPPIPVAPVRRVAHTVKPGETLASIAARYRVSVEDLRRWNRGIGRLLAGHKLTVEVQSPVRGKPRTPPKGKPYRKAAS
jgi:membrane-bound lytic murein transglycosylase D